MLIIKNHNHPLTFEVINADIKFMNYITDIKYIDYKFYILFHYV